MAAMQQESSERQQSPNKSIFQTLGLTGRIKNVSTDFSHGWKSLATKAKKEVNTLNKKARKALTTYEEGSSVQYDQIYDCDFDAGFLLWQRFQKSWVNIRNHTVQNVSLAEDADIIIHDTHKNWQKWDSIAVQFRNNLMAIPDIIAQVEIAQTQIEAIGNKISKVEMLLLNYEDACERVELERKKYDEKVDLSVLVEKRQRTFQDMKARYEMTEEESGEIARVFERQASIEKQQVYEDAFMEQMEKYLQCGEFDRPIAGSAGHDHQTEEISFDESDLEALREFLGPEEMDTVMRSQAVVSAAQNNVTASASNDEARSYAQELALEENQVDPLKRQETKTDFCSDNLDSNLEVCESKEAGETNDGDLESIEAKVDSKEADISEDENLDLDEQTRPSETDDQEEVWFDSQTAD